MGSPLNRNARKVGKRSRMTALQLHDAIREATEEHGQRVREGLQYVKIGDEWVSIQDTDKIERILNGG